MPENPSLTYIALFLFSCGAFLVVAGLKIVRVEKVTVTPGFKTWGIGLLLIFLSIYLLTRTDFFEGQQTKASVLTTKSKKQENQVLPKVPKVKTENKPIDIVVTDTQKSGSAHAKVRLQEYYDLLNNKNTDKAWGFLSKKLQKKLFDSISVYPAENYKKWWLTEVDSIEVVSMNYLEGYPTNEDAKIDAKLIYVLKGGVKCSDDHSIFHIRYIYPSWVMFDKNKVSLSKSRKCL